MGPRGRGILRVMCDGPSDSRPDPDRGGGSPDAAHAAGGRSAHCRAHAGVESERELKKAAAIRYIREFAPFGKQFRTSKF